MIARRTLLALGVLLGLGAFVSAPAQAGHERTTVVYKAGYNHHDYHRPKRHRAVGDHHARPHWRAERRHHRQHHWKRSHYRGDHHYRGDRHYRGDHHYRRHEPGYRIWFEYRN